MAVRKVTTQLTVDGETEFKRQLKSVNNELRNVGAEMRLVDAQFKGQANSAEALTRKQKLLEDAYANEKNKIEALEQAVRGTSEAYGEADPRVDAYRRQLLAAQTALIGINEDLQKNKKYLNEASESADGFATSIDGFGKEVKDAGGGLRGALSALRNEDGSFNLSGVTGALGALKMAFVGGAIVTGAAKVKDAILEVVESTEEYRTAMANLELSFTSAGYSAEVSTEIYTRFYEVLGDTQQAQEAAAILASLELSEGDLVTMTDALINVWVKSNGTIPVSQLAEATRETINVGKATGNFVDVLNTANISEDEFNQLLESMVVKTEKVNAVMSVMTTGSLSGLAEGFREANPEIIQMNRAQLELQENMARLGELLTPLAAGIVGFTADIVSAIVNAIDAVSSLIDKFRDLETVSLDRRNASIERRKEAYASRVNGSHASGLERVPYDGYIAELHRDEMVLTRPQAAAYRAQGQTSGGSSAQSVTIDMTLELDGATLARKQYTYNQAEAARRGASRAGKAVP